MNHLLNAIIMEQGDSIIGNEIALSIATLLDQSGVREHFRAAIDAWLKDRQKRHQAALSKWSKGHESGEADAALEAAKKAIESLPYDHASRRYYTSQYEKAEKQYAHPLGHEHALLPLHKTRKLSDVEQIVILAAIHDSFFGDSHDWIGPKDGVYLSLVKHGVPSLTQQDLPYLKRYFAGISVQVASACLKMKPTHRKKSVVREWSKDKGADEVLRRIEKGMTIPQIADDIGCNKQTIYGWMEKNKRLAADVAKAQAKAASQK